MKDHRVVNFSIFLLTFYLTGIWGAETWSIYNTTNSPLPANCSGHRQQRHRLGGHEQRPGFLQRVGKEDLFSHGFRPCRRITGAAPVSCAGAGGRFACIRQTAGAGQSKGGNEDHPAGYRHLLIVQERMIRDMNDRAATRGPDIRLRSAFPDQLTAASAPIARMPSVPAYR